MKRSCQGFSALLPLLLLLSGCGGTPPAGTVVHGKIYMKGAPVKVNNSSEDSVKKVFLYPMFEGGIPDGADIKDDGTFEFRGYGEGVPAGEYRIGVEIRSEFGTPDQLRDRFSEKNSRITRNIDNSGDQDLGIINLDKPNG